MSESFGKPLPIGEENHETLEVLRERYPDTFFIVIPAKWEPKGYDITYFSDLPQHEVRRILEFILKAVQ